MFDFESGKLLPHTHRYFATGLPEFNYHPDATCALWEEKLGEWLAPSFHPTLQEFVGYLLTPDTRIEALLAMIGATRGGKGTISQVMQWLVSREHYTARTLNDLGGSFGLEGCTDKRIIFIPDAHDSKVDNRNVVLDRLKCISGNDDVSVNRKNKTIVTTRIPAKIVLVANRHPKFLDESGALAARQVLLIFGNSFKGKEDRDLRAKLRDELPGIANWALDGLRRLRMNGNRFTIGAEGNAASRELAESQSPALRFAHERLTVTGDLEDHVPLADAYAAYEDWAAYTEGLSSRERRNRDDFKHDLMAALMTKGVQHGRRRWHDPALPRWERHGKGERVYGFFGFKIKPQARVPD
jgi:phage/plasmid-associated DNA primase